MKRKIYTLWMLLYLGVLTLTAQEKNGKVNIWEGTDCHRIVEMTPYLAPGHNNVAVVVCPGGSYFWHDMEAEGKAVGEWLQKYGISAFVLHYQGTFTTVWNQSRQSWCHGLFGRWPSCDVSW